MPAIEAVLFDYGNTIVQYDRPQIEWIHARLSRALSRLLAPVDPMVLGAAMDHVCVQPHLSPDLREYTPCEQMELVLRKTYGDSLPLTEETITAANAAFQNLFVSSIRIEDESVGVVRRLSRKVRLGLVSNYPCGDSLRRSLRSTGIANCSICSGVPLPSTLAPKSPVLAPQLSANDGLTRAISTTKVVRA